MTTSAKPFSVERADRRERELLSAAVYARLARKFAETAMTEAEENEMIPDSYLEFEYDEVQP